MSEDVFSPQMGRSSGEITERFLTQYFIPDVACFTSTGTPLAKASQQVQLGSGGRNPAMVDVTENVSRQLGIIIQYVTTSYNSCSPYQKGIPR